MKFKQILICSLFTLMFFVGFSNVDAKSYTSYNKGDKVSVNVSDSTKLDFYVIEDSDNDSSTIKGLSYNFANNNTYNFSEATVFINTLKSTWSNCVSVAIPSAEDLLGHSVTLDDTESSITLTSPTWISPITSSFTEYWLSNTPFTGYNSVVWGMDTYYNTNFKISVRVSTESIYIRPIITISKENVVGGITLSESDQAWIKFVEKFKTSTVVEYFENEGNTVNITSTDSTLKIVMNDGTNTYTTNFTYANGIISYVPGNSDSEKMIDAFWITNCLSALDLIKGYDDDQVSDWLENQIELTLTKDGIEFIEKDLTIGDGESSITSLGYDSFKLDIVNGLKTFKPIQQEEIEKTVENPKTGIYYGYVVLALIIAMGSAIYFVTRKKSKFPQA